MNMKRLVSYVHLTKDGSVHSFGPADDLPKWAVDAIDNPKAWADTATSGSDQSPHADLKVDALKAEITSRNEVREDDAKIPDTGLKADLIAALDADDATTAGAGNPNPAA